MKIGLKCISLAVAFFVSILLLARCNGSGSSSSKIKYTGSTDQVRIDEDNAIQVATNAYENIYSPHTIGDSANIGMILENYENTPPMLALALSLLDIFEKSEISSGQSGAPYTGAVYHDSWTEDGEYGGEAVINWSYDIDTDERSMTIKFQGYCTNEGIILDGTVKMEGGLYSDQSTMTFKKLESTFEGSGKRITMSGTIEIDETYMSTILVMNMTMRDNTTNNTYKVEAMEVEIIDSGSAVEVILSGKFYDHDYGYCDISTEVSLKFLEDEVMPYQGSLLITGDNGIAGSSTKARFTIIGWLSSSVTPGDSTEDRSTTIILQQAYHVRADTNGDGTFNYDSGPIFLGIVYLI